VTAELAEDVDEAALHAALAGVAEHHDALRMRFEHLDGDWRQHNAPVEPAAALERHDLSAVDPAEQRGVTDEVAAPLPASFDPALPLDHHGANTVTSTRSVTVALDPDDTRALLADVPGTYRTQINDVLLAALGQVLSRWTGADRVLITLEGHGREELLDGVDLSRTVGWFTTLFPVALDMAGDRDWGETLKSVKEQLRAVPRRGLGYGALRYLRQGIPQAESLAGGPEPQVSFNYLGQFDWASDGDQGLYRAMLGGLGGDVSSDA